MSSGSELAKLLLLVACILGVLQGLLTFIGGITACFDRNKDVIFKSYCSSMSSIGEIQTVSCLEAQLPPRSSSRTIQEIAGNHIVTTARLIRQIEVGLRESIRIVRFIRMTMMMIILACQEVIPLNLLCLLLLYVVFFGL